MTDLLPCEGVIRASRFRHVVSSSYLRALGFLEILFKSVLAFLGVGEIFLELLNCVVDTIEGARLG